MIMVAFDTPTFVDLGDTFVWLALHISGLRAPREHLIAWKALYIHRGGNLGGVRLDDQRHLAAIPCLTLEGVTFEYRQKLE